MQLLLQTLQPHVRNCGRAATPNKHDGKGCVQLSLCLTTQSLLQSDYADLTICIFLSGYRHDMHREMRQVMSFTRRVQQGRIVD